MSEHRDRGDWIGATVFVLSIAVALVLVIVAAGVVFGDTELGRARESYAGVLGAVVGSIATYIGLYSARRRNGL